MSDDNFGLSKLAEFRRLVDLNESEESDREREEIRKRLAEDKRASEKFHEKTRRRHALLMETYGWRLVGENDSDRKATARRAAREIKDPADREWLARKVAEASKAVGWNKKRKYSKKGYLKRAAEKQGDILGGMVRGAIGIGENYAGLGRVIGGGDTDRDNVQFAQLLEAAYLSGDPRNTASDSVATKATKGFLNIIPQLYVGAKAASAGGTPGLTVQAGTMEFAPIRERLVSEGVDPKMANAIGALAAAAVGRIEATVKVPGMGKSGAAGIGEAAAKKLATKLALGKTGTKALESAGKFGSEYLMEVAGEEFPQGGVGAAASLAGAATAGKTEGRSLMEIPREALGGAREAALPMLFPSMFGGGMHMASGIQQQRMRARVEEFARMNNAPSRRQAKQLGLPVRDDSTIKERLDAVKEMSKAWAELDALGEESVSGGESVADSPELQAALEEKSTTEKSAAVQQQGAESETERQKNERLALQLKAKEEQLYKDFYANEQNAVAWVTKNPKLAKQLVAGGKYTIEAFQKVDPDLPPLDNQAFRRKFFTAVNRAVKAGPKATKKYSDALSGRKGWKPLPNNVEDVPEGFELLSTPSGMFYRLKTATETIKPQDERTFSERRGEVVPWPAESPANVIQQETSVEPGSPAVEQGSEPPVGVQDKAFSQDIADFMAGESGALSIKEEPSGDVAGLSNKEAQKAMQFLDQEEEERHVASNVSSADGPSRLKRIGARLKLLWQASTRTNIRLSNKPENDVAKEIFRLERGLQDRSLSEAIDEVAPIVAPLSPIQLDLFERIKTSRNQLRSLYAKVPEPLRHGNKSAKSVEAKIARLLPLVEATPLVKQAIKNRQEMKARVVGRLVDNKLLPEQSLEDIDAYWHQQVLVYRNVRKHVAGGGGKKSFQKKRVTGPEALGREYDYNTNYIESEVAWLTQAFHSLTKNELGKKLEGEYDRISEFDAQAREEKRTLREIAKESGYEIVSKELLYSSGAGIESKIMGQYKQSLVKNLNLTEEELELVNGGKEYGDMAIPKEIAAQLMDNKKNRTGLAADIAQIERDMMGAWKAWTLLNPTAVLGYNLRNSIGDTDPMVAAYPTAVMDIPDAWRDIRSLGDPGAGVTDMAKISRRFGVVDSGFASTETLRVGESPVFRRLNRKASKRRNIIDIYMENAVAGTRFRENLLRQATFRNVLKRVKSGNLEHFGATNRQAFLAVQRVLGDEAAAARITRDLIGDYSNLTVMGSFLRDHLLPFWSFVEINSRRYPRILMNSFQAGKGRTAASAVLAKTAVARMGMLYGLVTLWNSVVLPAMTGDDDDSKKSAYDRSQLGINLGRNSDGTMRTFRNVGALGDLMEWVGINEAIQMMPRLKNGQVDKSDIASEIIKAPFEKLIGLLRPDIKGGVEVLSGKSPWPEPFGPWRSVDKGEAIANMFGMSDELKFIRGKVTGSGERARPHYFQRWLMGVTDPRSNSLSKIYDLRNLYLKRIGSPEKGSYPISEYRIARQAAEYDDREAFLQWKEKFIERHGVKSVKRFAGYLRRVDPLTFKLSDINEWKFEHEFLTNEQRDNDLRAAREYAAELREKMILWWIGEGSNK